MSIGAVPNYGSASNWMTGVVGHSPQQYANTFDIGRDNNRYWGNNILPKNFNGTTFGGSRKRRRGGTLAGVVSASIAPLTILGMQQNYKRSKSMSKSRMKRNRSRRRYR